ncbi:hypothetical protein D9O36_03275 [Zobellia amurskyensis]|uniref:Uncharacterized protein n=1 Tax=Zobellia amurskyensis TaxID=248905 RepID=A0A7X2ZR51_9FLAO|nr:hypothetical protein [Zobellia amurskyensis]
MLTKIGHTGLVGVRGPLQNTTVRHEQAPLDQVQLHRKEPLHIEVPAQEQAVALPLEPVPTDLQEQAEVVLAEVRTEAPGVHQEAQALTEVQEVLVDRRLLGQAQDHHLHQAAETKSKIKK